MSGELKAPDSTNRMKVFVSYSRDDVAFADQLVVALEDRGFDPFLDRHDIDAAENWKERLGGLILSCDAVVFVLTDRSAASPVCGWEVDEAAKLGKRIIPVVPRDVTAPPPQALAALNWVHFHETPAIPGSGMFDGLRKLDRALRVDLAWLRDQTRLSERAAEWMRNRAEDRLLRGAALKEALDWLDRAPADSNIPVSVRDYIAACADAEQAREAAARTQLAEREQALKDREQAVRDRARSDARLRRVSMSALVAGVVLLAAAGAALWLAGVNSVEAGKQRAELFANASHTAIEEHDYLQAAMIAVAGGGGGNDGLIAGLLNPDGHIALHANLARANSDNRLIDSIDIREQLNSDNIQIDAVAAIPESNRYIVFWYNFDNEQAGAWVYEVGSEQPVERHELDIGVTAAYPFPDGDRVLVWWDTRRAGSIWSLKQKKAIQVFAADENWLDLPDEAGKTRTDAPLELRDDLNGIAIDPKYERVITANADGHVRVWRVGQPDVAPVVYRSEAGHRVNILRAAGDGSGFITSDNVGRLNHWRFDLPDKPAHTLELEDPPNDIVWMDGNIATATRSGAITVLDSKGVMAHPRFFRQWIPFPSTPPTGDRSVSLIMPSPNLMYSLAFSDDPRLPIKIVRSYSGRQDSLLLGKLNSVGNAAFISPAQALVTAADDGTIRVWSFGEAFTGNTFIEKDAAGEWTFAAHTVATNNGVTVAIDGSRKLMRVWRDGKPEAVDLPAGFADSFGAYWSEISPDGTLLVGPAGGDETRIWRIGTTEPIVRIPKNGDYLYFKFHKDSQRYITANSKQATVWRIGEDKPLAIIPGKNIGEFALSPDGERVAIVTDDNIEVWRLTASAPEVVWDPGGAPEALEFAPDGENLFLSREDGNIGNGSELLMYNLKTGRTIAYSTEGLGELDKFVFSNDGKLMLGVTSGSTTLVWLIGYPYPIQRIDSPGGSVETAAFDAGGRHILLATLDTMMRRAIEPLVFASDDEALKIVCARAARLGFGQLETETLERFSVLAGTDPEPCVARGLSPRD